MTRRQTSSSPAIDLPEVPVRPDEEVLEEGDLDVGGDGEAPAVRADKTGAWMVAPASHGQRLDAFLAAAVPEHSRSHLKQLIEDGCAQVAGVVVTTPSRKVQAGQTVEVVLRPTAQSQAFVAEPMALPIVFEDAHLLVVDKPAGLVVHPAAGNWSGTLMNGLLAHHAGANALPRAGIVHRLDKDTSGLMVVGKTLEAVTALSRAIAAREVKRQYLAITHGVVPEHLTIEAPLARDPVSRVRMAVVPSGKPAKTDVACLVRGRGGLDGGGGPKGGAAVVRDFSGVLCTLHTGRTHQIRVHLASRGHPLVADALYGGQAAWGMGRQALHAARLAFTHPHSGEPMAFTSALPADMSQAWGRLSGEGESNFTAGATTRA